MRPLRSLRVRLLAGAAVWVTLALIGSGVALVSIFEASIEQRSREDLVAIRNRLVAALSPQPDPATVEQTLTDPRYETPFGGLYWQVEDLGTGEIYRSRSLWDTTIPFPRSRSVGDPVQLTLDGPDQQKLSALGGLVSLESPAGTARFLVTVARDRADADQAIRRFGFEMTIDLLILGAALLVAVWVQVELGLRPLRKLAGAVEAIRTGRAANLGSEYPTEVVPLVTEVNELLSARDRSIEVARSRATELAHSLKTPMAVVSATAEKLVALGDKANATTLASLAHEVSDEIDYHLRLSGIRPRDSTTVLCTSLNTALLRTISVLRKTKVGETLHWQLELGNDSAADIDEHDLLELAGIVLENAAKWATSQVQVSTDTGPEYVVARVSDDGPGLTEDQIGKIGVRGQRLRQDKPGSGFGLAIALEIAATNRGSIEFGRSSLGGLDVAIRLPRSD